MVPPRYASKDVTSTQLQRTCGAPYACLRRGHKKVIEIWQVHSSSRKTIAGKLGELSRGFPRNRLGLYHLNNVNKSQTEQTFELLGDTSFSHLNSTVAAE